MIRVKELRVSYGLLKVLDGIDIEVNKGDTVAIVGSYRIW
jgi:ABC-type polar amino acid transport system ATPase subunit